MQTDDGLCLQCAHNFDNHVLMSLDSEELFDNGGVILCPSPGCECYSTFSLPENKHKMMLPDRFSLALLRERIQSD